MESDIKYLSEKEQETVIKLLKSRTRENVLLAFDILTTLPAPKKQIVVNNVSFCDGIRLYTHRLLNAYISYGTSAEKAFIYENKDMFDKLLAYGRK